MVVLVAVNKLSSGSFSGDLGRVVVLVAVNKLSSGSCVSRMGSQPCLFGQSIVSSVLNCSGVPWFFA